MGDPVSPWGPGSPDDQRSGPPPSLLELQAELAETAQTAALKAGARRVTITMSDGIHVEAVFGDPGAADEDQPSRPLDVD